MHGVRCVGRGRWRAKAGWLAACLPATPRLDVWNRGRPGAHRRRWAYGSRHRGAACDEKRSRTTTRRARREDARCACACSPMTTRSVWRRAFSDRDRQKRPGTPPRPDRLTPPASASSTTLIRGERRGAHRHRHTDTPSKQDHRNAWRRIGWPLSATATPNQRPHSDFQTHQPSPTRLPTQSRAVRHPRAVEENGKLLALLHRWIRSIVAS